MRVGAVVVRRLQGWALAGLVVACAHGGPAPGATQQGAAQPSPAGQWEGVARAVGSPPVLVRIILDSAGGAWHGTFFMPGGDDPVPFASVSRERDSVVLQLPATLQGAVLRARISSDGRRLDGTIASGEGGTFTAARAGTRAAAALAAEGARVEASRRRAMQLPSAPAAVPHADPDSAHLVTSDVALFWRTIDRAPADSLAAYLERDYIEGGSVAVRDFIPGRIMSAEDLAAYVRDHRARYDSVRAANLDVTRADTAIRAAFRRLKALYPAAMFPDVYFVVGRFNTGGTSTKHGLLIGAEMYRDPARLPAIVSHEIIHFQQHYRSRTLLEQSFLEGTADFLGEMISGAQINNTAKAYGLAHEHELWREFRAHAGDHTFFPWMYGKPPDGRPNDLGYFIGYRIAQAYYQRATDKAQAIRDIIAGGDGPGGVKGLLAKSGYDP